MKMSLGWKVRALEDPLAGNGGHRPRPLEIGWLGLLAALIMLSAPLVASPLPGDADGNGRLEHGDIRSLIDFLYLGGEVPPGDGDVNGDGEVDGGDVVVLRQRLGAEIPTFVHPDLPSPVTSWHVPSPGDRGSEGPDEIFVDGFEGGGFSAWSAVAGFDFQLTCQTPDPDRATLGAIVTLVGTDFLLGSTRVFFAGPSGTTVEANLLDATSTRLRVEVPVGAVSGPLTVDVINVAGVGSAVCGEFTLNGAPVLEPIGDRVAPLGQTTEFDIVATDDDGDPLTYSVSPVPLPLGATFDGTAHTFSFRPTLDQVGDYELTFRVDDGESSDEETLLLSVPQPSAETTLAGVVLTLAEAPLAGVRLVYGVDEPVETVSQADGSFLLEALPVAGRQRLLIDGSTVPGAPPGTYATVPEQVDIIEGGENVLEAPIYLLPLDLESADPVVFEEDSLVTSRAVEVGGVTFAEIQLTVSADSATMEGGGEGDGEFNGDVSITRIPSPELGPMPLPDDLELSLYIAVQPFGVRYDPPAEIAFPNVEGFAVGVIVDIFGLNHDTGRMEKVGDGRVDADGMIYSGTLHPDGSFTRHGVVRENSWHGFVPAPPFDGADPANAGDGGGDPAPCGVGSDSCPRTGDLAVAHDLVSYRSMGVDRALRLEYHSQHAFPHPVISRLWTPGNLAPAPQSMSTRLTVAGTRQGAEIFFEGPPCSTVSCPLGRFPATFDASNFVTGIYPADLTLSCLFPISRRDTTYSDTVQVINRVDSPFGAGWSLAGLSRIHRTVTGDLLLTNEGSEGLVFTPARRAASQIVQPGERDFYRVAASRGERLSLRMRRRSNQGDGSGTLDPVLEIRDSRGFLLATDDNGGEGSVEGPGENAEILAIILPATDTYTVIARGAGGTTGPYELFLTAESDTAFVEGQAAPPEVIEPAFVFLGDIAQIGERDSHTFAASVGTRVSVEVDRLANQGDGSGSLDPAVEIRNSQGFVVFSNNDGGSDTPPGPGRNALIPSVELPATDTYTLVVSGSGGTIGPYEARITFGDLTGGIEVGSSGGVDIEPVVISPPGEYSVLSIDADLGTITRRLKDGTFEHYNGEGRLRRIEDRNGNSIVYAYDGDGRLQTLTDPVGRVTTLQYADAAPAGTCRGRLSEIIDPAGRITQFRHDSRCNLTSIVDPDGAERRFAYDDDHLLTSQTSPRGVASPQGGDFVTEYRYDFSGRFYRSVLADGLFRELESHQSIGLVPPPISCEPPEPDLGCPDRLAPALAVGEIEVLFTDAEGRVSNLGALNALGHATGLRDALGRSTVIDRDLDGNPTRIVLPSGHGQRFTYDDRGNLTLWTDERLQSTTELTYVEPFGRVETLTEASGSTSFLEYDPQGNLSRLVSPTGRTLSYSYRDDGLVETTVDFNGLTTYYSYDDDRRLDTIRRGTGAEERTTQLQFDGAGNLTSVVDALGRSTGYEYDAQNRLTRQMLPGNRSVLMSYDVEGNLASLKPPGRPAHLFLYDARNRLLADVPPDIGSADPSTVFMHNGEGQLRQVLRPDGRSANLFYNGAGQLLRMETPRGDYLYSYASFSGLLRQVTSPGGEVTTIDYFGSVPTRISSSGAATGSVSLFFNTNGRLSQRQVNSGLPIHFSYDDDGFLTEAGDMELARSPETGRLVGTRLETMASAISYNVFSELSRVTETYDDDPVVDWSYSRDDLGRLIEVVETAGPTSKVTAYGYDLEGRLRETRVNGSVAWTYAYDANGNRLVTSSPGGTQTATYDDQDRLLTFGDLTYSYTENGELTGRTNTASGESSTFVYDLFSNLLEATLPDGRLIEYSVDGLNRRIGKSIDGVPVQGFIYADQLRPIAELDGQGAVVSRFVYGSKTTVPDYLIKDGQTYRILSDHIGSPRWVVDVDDGSIVQAIEYDPFGRVLSDSNPGFQPFGFAGGLYDSDTGLVRFGARDYDPEVGRWTAKDPIRFAAGDPNLYGYVFNDPVNLADPSGEILPLIFAGAAIGALVNVTATLALDLYNGQELSGQRLLAAGLNGAIAGGIGAIAGPLGGTLARSLGGVAGRLGSRLFATGISAGGGALGQVAQNAVDPCNASSIGNAALFAGLGGAAATFFPAPGVLTLAQAKHFTPNLGKLLRSPLAGALFTSSGIGAAAVLGGPFN